MQELKVFAKTIEEHEALPEGYVLNGDATHVVVAIPVVATEETSDGGKKTKGKKGDE